MSAIIKASITAFILGADTCDSGWFYDEAQTDCVVCPIGSWCQNSTRTECEPGTYQASTGQQYCEECASGWHQTELGSIDCVPCARGMFCSNSSAAQPCAPGTYQSDLAGTSCRPCESGQYQPESASAVCHECPAGYMCPSGSVLPIGCPTGSYQAQTGQSTCVKCAPGQYKLTMNSTTPCASCPSGFMCPIPSEQPVICPTKSYAYGGASGCSACDDGFYQDQPGQSSCLPCPTGHYCRIALGSQKLTCWKGWYNDLQQQSECTKCPSGSYASENGTVHCSRCPSGSSCYYSGTATPVLCKPGYYAQEGAESCTSCPSGTYQDESGGTECKLCPVGHYCYYSKSTEAKQCSPGQYNEHPGQTSCTDCPVGHSCPHVAQVFPLPCMAGLYQDKTAQSSCSPCASGQYQLREAAHSCHPCPVGYVCPAADKPPVSTGDHTNETLPAGHYGACAPGTSMSVSAGVVHCKPCSKGTYQAVINGTSCISCPAGSWCPRVDVTPIPCPISTFSLGRSVQCTHCAPGSQTVEEGSSTCADCAAGYYCAENCPAKPCAKGTFSGPGDKICSPCPHGTFNMLEAQLKCTEQCPVGKYCPAGTIEPLPCKKGTFNDKTGADICAQCPKSYFCPNESMIAPQPCPIGTSQINQGQSICMPCLTGFFQDRPAQSECIPCPVGFVCVNATGPPAPCPPGTYQDEQNQVTCKYCDKGQIQLSVGQAQCKPCPAGYKCVASSDKSGQVYSAVPCEPGSYSLKAMSDCDFCKAGKYASGSASEECSSCGEGKFCPSPGGSRFFSCPSGQSVSCRSESGCNPCGNGKTSSPGLRQCSPDKPPCNLPLDAAVWLMKRSFCNTVIDGLIDAAIIFLLRDNDNGFALRYDRLLASKHDVHPFWDGGDGSVELKSLLRKMVPLVNEQYPHPTMETATRHIAHNNFNVGLPIDLYMSAFNASVQFQKDIFCFSSKSCGISSSLMQQSLIISTARWAAVFAQNEDYLESTLYSLQQLDQFSKESRKIDSKMISGVLSFIGRFIAGAICQHFLPGPGGMDVAKCLYNTVTGKSRADVNDEDGVPKFLQQFVRFRSLNYIQMLHAPVAEMSFEQPALFLIMAYSSESCRQSFLTATSPDTGDLLWTISAEEAEDITGKCPPSNISEYFTTSEAIKQVNDSMVITGAGRTAHSMLDPAIAAAITASVDLPTDIDNPQYIYNDATLFTAGIASDVKEIGSTTKVVNATTFVQIPFTNVYTSNYTLYAFTTKLSATYKGQVLVTIQLPVKAAATCKPIDLVRPFWPAEQTTKPVAYDSKLIFHARNATANAIGAEYYFMDVLMMGPVRYLLFCEF